MIYKKELLDINWYLNHMSMFLKESYGIVDQYQWFVDQLNSIDFVCDNMTNVLDLYNLLWNENNPWSFEYEGVELTFKKYSDFVKYFDNLNEGKGIDLTFLDVIANLNGISREFVYTYYEIPNENVRSAEPQKITEVVRLNNADLYRYILITIAKNNYDGTYEMIKKTYERAFDGELKITYFSYNSEIPLTVDIGIIKNGLSPNVIKAFQSELFIIKSMGIAYNVKLLDSSDELFKLDMDNNLDNPRYVL